MRLYDTATRTLQELPPPPGPIRIYACGPTVYQRIHVGNARPFVLSLWLRRWLVSRGYEVRLAENITDVNDKIYDAAPGASADLGARAAGWEGEDTWWESPWGRGRPGWHIECSAMAEKFLGPSFEIHMGGIDLVFPHHENEVAQSRGAGREFARLWMHNGLLQFTGGKMSKSL